MSGFVASQLRRSVGILLAGGLSILSAAATTGPVLRLTSRTGGFWLTWTNPVVPGICTIEQTSTPDSAWTPGQNVYATNSTGLASISPGANAGFFRLRTVEVAPTSAGFTNFIQAYGLLETLAGMGEGRTDGVNYWIPEYEGGPAASASLSRPHYAMADLAGNIYVVDKNSHSVLRRATNGLIYTHAGTHAAGFNGDGPAPATNLHLNFPNALWVLGDGTVYVLDTDNGRVRRIGTNGIMTTLFLATSDGSALSGGRSLWVRDDETLAYFGATTRVRRWTPTGGLTTLTKDLVELGTFFVESSGDVIVADRGGNYVYRVKPDETRTVIAGNGQTAGGGDGFPALATGLWGPRGIWAVPTGGYLILTHDSCQLWYMDTAGILRLLLSGAGGSTHSGDGTYFYAPDEWRISEGRSVSMDAQGHIILCESDYGYIRRVRFERLAP